VNTGFFAAQGEARGFGLEALASADRLGQGFASSAAALFGPCFVDFIGALGRVGQNQHLVAGDLQEASADCHRLFGATLFDADHAWQQGRQQRRMARQDTYDAFGARCDHHVNCIFGKDFAFRGDNLDT
jgi:hypothetical protein